MPVTGRDPFETSKEDPMAVRRVVEVVCDRIRDYAIPELLNGRARVVWKESIVGKVASLPLLDGTKSPHPSAVVCLVQRSKGRAPRNC